MPIMKNKRHELILQAVARGDVATQEQLLEYLRGNGVDATQATVSRDMKELRLRKSAAGRGGKAVYEVTPPWEEDPGVRKYRAILAGAVEGVDGAGHIVCVRCGAGMAQSACAAIDALPPFEGLVGSLAGEDTVFLLCRTEEYMQAIQEELRNYVGQPDN